MEYYDVPRGRVLWNGEKQKFLVYGPMALMQDEKIQNKVTEAFGLLDLEIEFLSDRHYEPVACK
ncbi:MAG: hypothetical protein HQL31_01270 [Planctomycetes bacterium]|nr:hypothetical protein [Planctomycetota bacterium]